MVSPWFPVLAQRQFFIEKGIGNTIFIHFFLAIIFCTASFEGPAQRREWAGADSVSPSQTTCQTSVCHLNSLWCSHHQSSSAFQRYWPLQKFRTLQNVCILFSKHEYFLGILDSFPQVKWNYQVKELNALTEYLLYLLNLF